MNGIPEGKDYAAGRRESVAAIIAGLESDDDETREEASQARDELALSVEPVRMVRIVLGTGGPHDELNVNMSTGAVTYGYYWGPERYEVTLDESDPLARYAADIAEVWGE